MKWLASAWVAVVVLACLGTASAIADESSGASIIDFGRSDAPGVQATAVRVDVTAPKAGATRTSNASTGSTSLPAIPAPVAISAHNCIPRVQGGGVDLSFEFFESGVGDCVSFVSPPPADPGPRRRPGRAPRPSPEALAQRAYERVIRLAPRPDLAAAPNRVGLTGLTSYFWVENPPRPISATAGVPRLSVTAEARPVQYRWDFGDGQDRTTRHPGRPWTRQTRGNVGHLYETKGRYEPSVTVIWAARWRINDGPWRDLGYFSTANSIEYPVREVRSLLVQGRRDR